MSSRFISLIKMILLIMIVIILIIFLTGCIKNGKNIDLFYKDLCACNFNYIKGNIRYVEAKVFNQS